MFHCAKCNAPVSADAEKCPSCNFAFGPPPATSSVKTDGENQQSSHWVRRLTYFIALCAVGYSSFQLAGPIFGFRFSFNVFTHTLGLPVPRMYGWDLIFSESQKNALSLGLLVLVLRRLGSMLVTGYTLPWSYGGPLYYLMLVPIWSLFLGIVGVVISFLIGAPATSSLGWLIATPALLFLASGIALVELLSLWPRNVRPNK